jgi:hypothetical protein
MPGLGPISEIGPGGRHAGRIVGLIPALETVGGIGAGLVAYNALRGHNDMPEGAIVGTHQGRVVKTVPVKTEPGEEEPA